MTEDWTREVFAQVTATHVSVLSIYGFYVFMFVLILHTHVMDLIGGNAHMKWTLLENTVCIL